MALFAHNYTRDLIDGAWDIDNPRLVTHHLAKKIESDLPGKPFVIRNTGSVCSVIFDLGSDLSAGEKATLDATVALYKTPTLSPLSVLISGSVASTNKHFINASLPNSSEFTYRLWAAPVALPARGALAYNHSGSNHGWGVEYFNGPKFAVLINSGAGDLYVSGTFVPSVGVYYAVYLSNGPAGLKLRVGQYSLASDQSLVTDISETEKAIVFSGANVFHLCGVTGAVAAPAQANLNESAYWSRQLTDEETSEDFADGLGLRYSFLPSGLLVGLVSYWDKQDASGNLVDQHGGYDLVPTGSTGAIVYQEPGPAPLA